MPPERMMKWGFLVKHERWLAVEGYSVTVSAGIRFSRFHTARARERERERHLPERTVLVCCVKRHRSNGLQVFSRAPEPNVKPALSQAPVEIKFQLTDCKPPSTAAF